MTDRNHDHCSELLGPLVRGELDERARREVSEHVAACLECRREHDALQTLTAPSEPLTEAERRELRATVRAATRARPAVITAPARRRPLRARLSGALAAAALVALVLGGGALVLRGGGGAPTNAAGEAQTDRGRAKRLSQTAQGRGGMAAEAQRAPAPRPTFEHSAGSLADERLARRGAQQRPFTSYALAYTAEDAQRLREDHAEDLVRQAGDDEAEQVRSCMQVVEDAQPYPILPAYGAVGTRDGRTVLALGFAWTDSKRGSLDRFQFWVFPLGACDRQVGYQSGPIDKR